MSSGISVDVDRELVVASIEIDSQEVDIAQLTLIEQDEAELTE